MPHVATWLRLDTVGMTLALILTSILSEANFFFASFLIISVSEKAFPVCFSSLLSIPLRKKQLEVGHSHKACTNSLFQRSRFVFFLKKNTSSSLSLAEISKSLGTYMQECNVTMCLYFCVPH